MVRDYLKYVWYSFAIVPPIFQRVNDREQLSVVDLVVSFRLGNAFRAVRDRVIKKVIKMLLRYNNTNSVI